jgi:hypothetical protein
MDRLMFRCFNDLLRVLAVCIGLSVIRYLRNWKNVVGNVCGVRKVLSDDFPW